MSFCSSSATLQGVEFTGNTAGEVGAGLLLRDSSSAGLTDTSFQDNQAALYGGGRYLASSCTATAASTDWVSNSPDDTYHVGSSTVHTWGTGAAFTCDTDSCY